MSHARDLGQMSAYDLIDYLDEMNPRFLPSHETPINVIYMEAGQRRLIESLMHRKEREING